MHSRYTPVKRAINPFEGTLRFSHHFDRTRPLKNSTYHIKCPHLVREPIGMFSNVFIQQARMVVHYLEFRNWGMWFSYAVFRWWSFQQMLVGCVLRPHYECLEPSKGRYKDSSFCHSSVICHCSRGC